MYLMQIVQAVYEWVLSENNCEKCTLTESKEFYRDVFYYNIIKQFDT